MSLLLPAAAAAGGLALAGAIAELAARAGLARFGGHYPVRPHLRQRLGVSRDALPMLEPEVHWRVNADGERGEPYRAGAWRLLLAGGSCVESYYLDQPTSVAGQLESILGEDANRPRLGPAAVQHGVHVGSVARSRMSCEQIEEMLAPNLPRYGKLDCVVLMIGASDMVRWLELSCPTEPWVDDPGPNHLWGLHPKGPFGWKPGSLALRALATRLRDRLAPEEVHRTDVGKRMIANRLARQAAPKLDEVPDPEIMLARFERGLDNLLATLEGVADRIVVARQPWFDKELTPEEDAWMWNFGQGVIYHKPVEVYYTHRVVRELMTAVAERCGTVARRRGHVDLHTPAHLEPGLHHYYDFFHYTPKGARRVAELMADAVLEA